MGHRSLGLGIGAAALLAFPAVSMGATIHVHPGDQIQRAVHRAQRGDLIKVHEGVYRQSVEITKNGLTLRGAGAQRRDGTVIKPPKDTKRCQGGSAGICILPHGKGDRRARTKDTEIEHFLIRGFEATGALAVHARRTTFSNNKFASDGEYGGAAFDAIRTKFLHNVATDNHEAGLYVGDSKRARAILRGNRARDNGEFGFFLRDASHGSVLRNEAAHNCMGIGLVDTGAPGGVRNWRVRSNEATMNNHFCAAGGGAPSISGAGIGVLGAKDSTIRSNAVLSNRPSRPADVSGGILVVATRSFGGGTASHNLIVRNHALKNKPADILWDGEGSRNRFRHNRCDSSMPGGLCL
jgi:nitrous oxidase accessory protein NosD